MPIKGGPKSGGRQRGSQSKKKIALIDACRRATHRAGWDPVVQLAVVATNYRLKGSTLKLRSWAAAEVARYLHPRLRSVEHSGAVDTGHSGVLKVPSDQLDDATWSTRVQGEDDEHRGPVH